MKYPLEEDNEENQEENIVEEENNEAIENDEHGLYNILMNFKLCLQIKLNFERYSLVLLLMF